MERKDYVAAGLVAGGFLLAAHVAGQAGDDATEAPAPTTPSTPPPRRLPRPGPNAPTSHEPRGRRLTRSHLLEAGNVREEPAELLAQALAFDLAMTLEEYTAARLAASEHHTGSMAELTAIIDAELNRAAERGRTLFASVTRGHGYGRQGAKRPASTARDPWEIHVRAALAVLRTGEARGAARGARRFFDPRAQLHLWSQGTACHPLIILERWAFARPWQQTGGKRVNRRDARGRRQCPLDRSRGGRNPEAWVGELPDIDSSRLMLFRRAPLGDAHTRAYESARATLVRNVTGAAVPVA